MYTYQHVRLAVGKGHLGALPKGLVLAVDPVVLANVLLESPDGQLALLLGQPRRRPREVGQHPVAAEGDDDGGGALDDEEPLPRRVAARAVHAVLDAGRDEAREGARDEGTRIHDGRSEAELLARIPAREVIQTSGAAFLLLALRSIPPPAKEKKHLQVRCLDETEKEADGIETGRVRTSRRDGRDHTPDDHLAEKTNRLVFSVPPR